MDEHKGDSDYGETVSVDWLTVAAIKTKKLPLLLIMYYCIDAGRSIILTSKEVSK